MLDKAYDPKAVEDRIYKMWEESGAFIADASSDKEPFTVSMPPPNATGQLHLGHAVMLALEDIFIRFNRMKGKEALWLPGTDHAAIATESVVIKNLQAEGIADPRAKFGREELLKKIAEFVEGSQDTIRSQVRKMGASCDWSRERYTMDDSLSRCVNEVFKKMYEDGLIYRGNRVVNWDVALQTTISDDEIVYQEREGVLWTFEYLSAEQTGGEPLNVATSRPETKLGDNAIIVHPDDERYSHLIGKTFDVDWPGNVSIKVSVIADHNVDREFGTGAIGCTPCHSKIDFEIWQRHKADVASEPKQVIGEDGKMTVNAGEFAGLGVEECREKFAEGLKKERRLISAEKYEQPLSISYRSKQPVEPIPKEQWFIDVNKQVVDWKGKQMSLKEVMQDVVHSGDIKIIPDRFEKTYFQWIDNLQDWCVSRQIWWGHRVPVYYCDKCFVSYEQQGSEKCKVKSEKCDALGEARGIYVSTKPLSKCPECDGATRQDSDTLDTWFSSGLWTWSTLVDPEVAKDTSLSLQDLLDKSPDFQKFHPTQVMETAYDILFFWVARMILMTTFATGQIPFDTVYLHGLVRTRDGKKMSKSDPETCIDPLEIIPKYGADALRLSMIVGQMPGNDFQLYEEKIGGYRNFINKLWNASRFILMKCEDEGVDPHRVSGSGSGAELSLADRALQSALDDLIKDVTKGLDEYRLSEVGEKLYSFIWDYFCDWYLELSKGETNINMLVGTLRTFLVLLHPYCPFVTEELWETFKYEKSEGMLISQPWPVHSDENKKDKDAERDFQIIIDVITAIRSMRADQGVEPGLKLKAIIHTKKHQELIESQGEHIERLAKLSELTIDSASAKHENAASTFLKDIEVHIPLEGVIDFDKEREKLSKEKEKLESFMKGIESKLNNKKFVANAPAEVVETEKDKLKNAKDKLSKIEESLKTLK